MSIVGVGMTRDLFENQFGVGPAETRESTTVGAVPSSTSAEPSSGNSWRYVPTRASSEGGRTPALAVIELLGQ